MRDDFEDTRPNTVNATEFMLTAAADALGLTWTLDDTEFKVWCPQGAVWLVANSIARVKEIAAGPLQLRGTSWPV